jgi:hypothetical protein
MANEQKQKIYRCHEWFKIKQFFAHKKQTNMDSYSKLSKNCKFSNFTNSNRQIKTKVNLPVVFPVLNAQNCTLFQITRKTYNIFKLTCVVSYSL